jgi:hypothetical protein
MNENSSSHPDTYLINAASTAVPAGFTARTPTSRPHIIESPEDNATSRSVR